MEWGKIRRFNSSAPPKGQLESLKFAQPPQGRHDTRALCRSPAFPWKRRSEVPQSVFPKEMPLASVLRRREKGLHNETGEANWRLRSEEHTSELQSLRHLVCRLLLEKKKKKYISIT